MAELVYKAEFPSDFESMTRALDEVVDALEAKGHISRAKEPCARMCLEEALVNAVRHGNQCDESRKVQVEILKEGEQLRVRVRDEGKGFVPEKIQLPEADKPGGRGICLIRHFADAMCFDKKNKCFEMLVRWV